MPLHPMPSRLSAIIVDDELSARENLKMLLSKYCELINVIHTFSGAEDAVPMINASKPDVLFLDIAMPNVNGFEMLQLLETIPSVVFVTAHEQFAMKAIKAAAVDFLLKPVNVEDLKNVQRKLLHLHELIRDNNIRENYTSVIKNFINMLQSREPINKITLPDSQGFNILNVKDILYLEGDNNYTVFHTREKKLTVSKTLKDYEEILHESGFLRIHKSSIINLQHLRNYSTKHGVEAVMSDDKVLSVSRRRTTEFLDKAKNYL